MFREATGTFYNDRWKPLFEGLTNIILSVVFVQWMGVVGVILATIITNILICHVVEPYVLYRHGFNSSPKKYYIQNYAMIGVFTLALVLLQVCMQGYDEPWKELLVNGLISVGMSLVICAFMFIFYRKSELFAKMAGRVKGKR